MPDTIDGGQHGDDFSYLDDHHPAESQPRNNSGACLIAEETEPEKPKNFFLQCLHTPQCLLVCLCIGALAQGMMVSGLVPVSLSTLEKRFHLSSTQSGAFASMYDTAVCLSLIPVCHFGARGNKARWLGGGLIMISIGAVICTLAQFLSDPYSNYAHVVTNTCPSDYNECGESVISSDKKAYALLLIGQILNGMGGAPLFTLGITYLDENVSQRSFPLYLGIFLGTSVLGPAMGYVLGGLFLSVYGDIGRVDLDSVKIDPSSPLWYGAWWLGFLVVSGLCFLVSIPLLMFPSALPGSEEYRKEDVDQSHEAGDDERAMKAGFGESLSDFFYTMKLFAKNPTFVCLIAVDCFEAIADQGVIDFLPKIIEHWYSVSASRASMYAGAVAIPSALFGNIIGGGIIRHYKLKCGGMVLFAAFVNFVCFALMSNFLASCDVAPLAGVTAPYSLNSTINGLPSTCNMNCSCSTALYNPVCFESGCTTSNKADQIFSNCSCPSLLQNGVSSHSNVVPNVCTVRDCNMMPIFLTFFGLLVFFSFLTSIPIQTAELRCVPFNQRTIAFGVRSLLFRGLGTIPGPILFGALVDYNCLSWKYKCDHKEECVMYDNRNLSYTMTALGMSVKFMIIICLFSAWRFYKPTKFQKAKRGSTASMIENNGVHHQPTFAVQDRDRDASVGLASAEDSVIITRF